MGTRYVTYGELELPTRYELFNMSKNGFDWGHSGPGARQLAFSMLYQLSNEEIAKDCASLFTTDVVSKFNNRDWIISASDIVKWISQNSKYEELQVVKKIEVKEIEEEVQEPKEDVQDIQDILVLKSQKLKKSKPKTNVVKEICDELKITQKQLSAILEIPEGTVSSWAVKNEIPRLGKKAIEFYIQSQKNQQIIESYKSFVNLLNVP
ncbi:MAG TPA: hypothetical protein CFH78_08160 [Sulfurimonas sp. UBA10385]|nr:MAG TPA: hypothetical protein CFH78_08160 [Sulfurimonas sp. UBA10385]